MNALRTMFYMLLSVAGLSFLSFMGIVAFQSLTGRVSGTDLRDMMQILGGNRRAVIPDDRYERFQSFLQDEAKARAELDENRGLPQTRVPAVLRAQEMDAASRENLAVLNRLLEEEKNKTLSVMAEADSQKRQIETLLRSLDEERAKNVQVEKDEATQKLRKTLSEMDAADIGTFLGQVVNDPSQGGPPEAARIVRSHLKADFSAEVLGEMLPEDRQKILPLLENRFAGVPPDAVARLFEDQKIGPGEQMEYLLQMNPPQALGVYLRLPAATQTQLAPRLLRGM